MNDKKKIPIYFISGLGADKRLFKNITLNNAEIRFINWIEPIKKETLKNYSLRLAQSQINLNEEFIIAGVSLGGMMASEIAAKFNNAKFGISISSIKTIDELPKLLKYTPIPYLLSLGLFKNNYSALKKVMGKWKDEDYLFFMNMFNDQSTHFMDWAIKAVLHWKRKVPENKIIEIHGTKDLLFPLKNKEGSVPYIIKNGSHLMVYNKAKEISKCIDEIILHQFA